MNKKYPYRRKRKKGDAKKIMKWPGKNGKAKRNIGGTTYRSNKKKGMYG